MNHVLEYLYEPFEHTASGKMILPHPFIGYKPDEQNGSSDGDTLICFLCQGGAQQHLMPEDMEKMRQNQEKEEADAQALDLPAEEVENKIGLAGAIRRQMIEDAERVLKKLENDRLQVDDFCPICFTNKIRRKKVQLGNAINEEMEEVPEDDDNSTARTLNDGQTFEDISGCRTCVECAIKIFKQRIDSSLGNIPNKIDSIDPDSTEKIEDRCLFKFLQDHDQTELIDRITNMRKAKEVEQDNMRVFCIQNGCSEVIRLGYINQKQVICAACNENMCAVCKRVGHGDSYCEDQGLFSPRKPPPRDHPPASSYGGLINIKSTEAKSQQKPAKKANAQTEEIKSETSLCPLCHSKNEVQRQKGKKLSVVHTCFFCQYIYCSCCGMDASPQADHFGYFSETKCNWSPYGVYKRPKMQYEQTCCQQTYKTIFYVLLGIILYPFVLAFTSVILMPYCLQRLAISTGSKIGLILIGILLGLILTPVFIVFAVFYTLFLGIMELLDCCGCPDCDCTGMGHHDQAYY